RSLQRIETISRIQKMLAMRLAVTRRAIRARIDGTSGCPQLGSLRQGRRMPFTCQIGRGRQGSLRVSRQKIFDVKSIPMAAYSIDFSRLEVYEVGAPLVTRLAFPSESELEETQSRVHASLCAYALRARSEIEPDWAVSPQPIKPI